MNTSRREEHKPPYGIRIIRKLGAEENEGTARQDLQELMNQARLEGEIKVLPASSEKFMETLRTESSSASMVMMGLPGNYEGTASHGENGEGRGLKLGSLFKLDEFFFTREIANYKNLPAVLFIRSARVMSLD